MKNQLVSLSKLPDGWKIFVGGMPFGPDAMSWETVIKTAEKHNYTLNAKYWDASEAKEKYLQP